MAKAVMTLATVLVFAGSVNAQQRFGVFEFFGRTTGAYCQNAAPEVSALQGEMAGRAVLLEYQYDTFSTGRVGRWWEAYDGPPSVYLPLVTVGSGFEILQGLDSPSGYRGMLERELARPAGASLYAWSQRTGNALKIYVRAVNTLNSPIGVDEMPTVWAIAWEDARIGLTQTWVRATGSQSLPASLPPGGIATTTITLPSVPHDSWDKIRSLVLFDRKPQGGGHFDMLQAAVARPATLDVSPATVSLGSGTFEAGITIDGPHLLNWTAVTDVPWLEVVPSSGGVPTVAKARLAGSPSSGATGTIRFEASGDGMAFTSTVQVTVTGSDPATWKLTVPAASHTKGAFETYWRTNLAAVNTGTETASIEAVFIPENGEAVTRQETLGALETREWADVLISLFQLDPGAQLSGALHLSSNQPLSVTSWTFTENETGSFGGFLPAIRAAQGLGPGSRGVLAQLRRSDVFRTNIGVTNLGDAQATVVIHLRGMGGETLGHPVPLEVKGKGLKQISDIFDEAEAGDQQIAYATIEVTSENGLVWAYASVVDNRSGDPSIIPLDIP